VVATASRGRCSGLRRHRPTVSTAISHKAAR
jgi:hypothetical protein